MERALLLLPEERWERYIAAQAEGPSIGPIELDDTGAPVAKDDETTRELRALHDEVAAAVADRLRTANLRHADLSADPEAFDGR